MCFENCILASGKELYSGIIRYYCKKKLNSLKRLVRTTVAESHN